MRAAGARSAGPFACAAGPATAHRHHDRLVAGKILVDFETGGAVSRDHGVRVEGMEECQPVLLGPAPRLAEGVGRRAVQHDLGAVPDGGRDLGARCPLRHHHHRAGAGSLRRPRHGLRVIPGRNRHHPPRALAVREACDRVERAAHLERARLLQILAFQPDGRADPVAQGAKRQNRRPMEYRRHAPPGVFEVLPVKQGVHSLSRIRAPPGFVITCASS